jgi:Ca2+-binding RTX toxin-like protein
MFHWTGLLDLFGTTYSITLGEGGADGAAVRTVNVGVPLETERDVLREIENVDGSNKSETITGNSGANTLKGNGGNDVIVGGIGADVLLGGSGADTFVWRNVNESSTTIAAMDRIVDFNPLAGDRINLSGIDADITAAGDQAFTFIGAAGFSGAPGEVNFVHVNGETIIQVQTGVEADAELGIRIAGIFTPEASWFVL